MSIDPNKVLDGTELLTLEGIQGDTPNFQQCMSLLCNTFSADQSLPRTHKTIDHFSRFLAKHFAPTEQVDVFTLATTSALSGASISFGFSGSEDGKVYIDYVVQIETKDVNDENKLLYFYNICRFTSKGPQ